MFRFFGFVVFLIFIVGVQSLGNNDCIHNYVNNNLRGFRFFDCSGDAEITVKWKKALILKTAIFPHQKKAFTLKLIVNDTCSLSFEGKEGFAHDKWIKGDKVTDCKYIGECDLQVNYNGKLAIAFGEEVGCDNVKNSVDNVWAWTKIRVTDFPSEVDFMIYDDNGSVEEYVEGAE
ncbi:hypothetical protein M3Y94_00006500 [Aphelenchoides besseyi]|nr:hypothetical protein M3Y94_00006500 [Aphelenchoides besseyi]KAI6220757.1 hypothetical protein M3Y95_01029900 [Aphelenchoides besseyi]